MEVAKAGADVTTMDHEGIVHNMWVIRDEKSIAKIASWCSKKSIYIADGHHRYETAAAYERDKKAADPYWSGDEPFNFVMMTSSAATIRAHRPSHPSPGETEGRLSDRGVEGQPGQAVPHRGG